MVIFGAGASYDSSQAYRPVYPGGGGYSQLRPSVQAIDPGGPWRPPLAKGLFLDGNHVLGDIVEKYPKLSHILPSLREPSNGRSVEQMLESLQDESREYAETQRELASVRFYLCELLFKVSDEWTKRTNGITNYAPLVKDILRFNSGEQVCLVTFNYDLLLERALITFDFKTKAPEEHLDSHPILKLFKLHGSVNWARVVDLPEGIRLSHQQLIERADTLQLTDRFVSANATDVYQMHSFGKPIFPAIAIPVQTKSEQHFECPTTHRSHLEAMLPDITKILIIGWQAKEAHFLKMLRSNLPKLKNVMVVGANKSDAQSTLNYFVGEIGLRVPGQAALQGGFTDFIVNQEGHPLFKA